ncbi:MAG TPA: hypothetical protein VE133_15100, partial [Candidatus Sulfotelmatobacter sp.]|nr:hypothetical protein [Candidatus Sulfotelmatobacter sp.]
MRVGDMSSRRVPAVLFVLTLACYAAVGQTAPVQPSSPTPQTSPKANAVATESAPSADDTMPVQT